MILDTKKMVRAIFLGITIFSVWGIFGLNGASAGTILQRPLYFGLNQGLVGFWTFDAPDMAGVTAYDRSGQGNTGTLTNGPTRQIGKIGQALAFTSNSDHVVRNSFSTFPTSAITVAFWMRSSDIVNDGTPLSYSVGGNNEFLIFDYGGFAVYINDLSASTGISANDGQWHHIAVTWRSSDGALSLYKDGVSVYSGTLSAGTPISGGGCLVIGEEQDAVCGSFQNTQAFVGNMDEVLIYDRNLSPDEIKRLYNMGATTKFNVSKKQDPSLNQGLVGLWTFDAPDMAGVAAYDRSGQNNTGTLTNGPTRQIGKIGQALNFDGVNDQIVISSGPSVSTNATIAGWFYWQSGVASLIRDDTSGFGWILAYDGNFPAGTIIFRVGNSEFNTGVNSASYLNKWTHYAVTKNGGAVVYYLNGIQVYASTGAGNTQNVLPWHIMMNGQNAQYIRGMTDDVRIYNRALSAEEIKRLYNMGATTKFNVSKKQDPSLNQGLVGLWTFDAPDMAGVTAYDRSGQGNNGTLTNGPKKVIGKIGQGLDFLSGTSAYVSTAMSGFNFNAGTISFWYKPHYSTDQTTTAHTFIIVGPNSYTAGAIRIFNNQQYQDIRISHAPASDFTSATVLKAENWYNFVYTWDSSTGFRRLYLNNTLDSSASDSWTPNTTPSSIIIGRTLDGSGVADGLIDDVRVYNRALSPDEIKRLYNMGR